MIFSAVTLYFQWICLVSSIRSDDSWFVNEMHAVMMQFRLIIWLF